VPESGKEEKGRECEIVPFSPGDANELDTRGVVAINFGSRTAAVASDGICIANISAGLMVGLEFVSAFLSALLAEIGEKSTVVVFADSNPSSKGSSKVG
jgi:hypothetical protein